MVGSCVLFTPRPTAGRHRDEVCINVHMRIQSHLWAQDSLLGAQRGWDARGTKVSVQPLQMPNGHAMSRTRRPGNTTDTHFRVECTQLVNRVEKDVAVSDVSLYRGEPMRPSNQATGDMPFEPLRAASPK